MTLKYYRSPVPATNYVRGTDSNGHGTARTLEAKPELSQAEPALTFQTHGSLLHPIHVHYVKLAPIPLSDADTNGLEGFFFCLISRLCMNLQLSKQRLRNGYFEDVH